MPPKDVPSPGPETVGKPPLFVEVFGRKALRELTREELGRPAIPEVITTPEGFNIGGRNDSSEIRALNSPDLGHLVLQGFQKANFFF